MTNFEQDKNKEPQFRPSWDDYFMGLARIVSTRATCDRLHNGAVLVKNKRIVSTGYNGSPPELEHCDDVGHLLEDGHCVRTIHSEHNAILQAAVIGGVSTKGTTLYSMYSPCIHCAKYIAAAGVERLVMGKVYRNSKIVDYLKQAGLQVDVYESTKGWSEYLVKMFEFDIEDKEGEDVKLESGKK